MSPQTLHALRQYGIMLVLAILGFFIENQTGILNTLNVPEIWQPIIVSALASSVRWVEGLRDAARAKSGELIPADVGYQTVQNAEAVLKADAEAAQARLPDGYRDWYPVPYREDGV